MSGLNSDQLHRSTLGIYTSLMEQFNPSLQRLVVLGHNYIQAFQGLAIASEEYFSALTKMGEQALQTMSSRPLGDVLIQISETQRRLNSELDGVFRWFHNDVLLEMDDNVRQDKDYISGSRRRYEMEVRGQATALERQQRRVGSQDAGEYVRFLKLSQGEALKEEERRYRFLAEKHCGLTQSLVYLMNKTGGALQPRAERWKEQVNETRASRSHTPSRMEEPKAEEWGRHHGSREEQPLGRVPSRGPSPLPTRSRVMRALVSHPPSSNPTMLAFSRGESVTVLVSEPRNGWLYGCAEGSTRQGWFPASYVEAADETPRIRTPSTTVRGSHSRSNLLGQSEGSGQPGPPPPPPPPPEKFSESRPITPTPSEYKRQDDYVPHPELFPRGTNPFATVKLKPTATNDRSAPRIL